MKDLSVRGDLAYNFFPHTCDQSNTTDEPWSHQEPVQKIIDYNPSTTKENVQKCEADDNVKGTSKSTCQHYTSNSKCLRMHYYIIT